MFEYLGTFCHEAIGGIIVVVADVRVVGVAIFLIIEDGLADESSSES